MAYLLNFYWIDGLFTVPFQHLNTLREYGWHQRLTLPLQEMSFTTPCRWFVKDSAFPYNTASPGQSFMDVFWATFPHGLQPPSLSQKPVEVSPASACNRQGQTPSSFSRDVVLFTLTFLQPLPNPFQQQSSNEQEFYYHYLIYPFSGHLQAEKVRPASSPLIEKFIFLLNTTSQASCVQHQPSHLWKRLGLFVFATQRDK